MMDKSLEEPTDKRGALPYRGNHVLHLTEINPAIPGGAGVLSGAEEKEREVTEAVSAGALCGEG